MKKSEEDTKTLTPYIEGYPRLMAIMLLLYVFYCKHKVHDSVEIFYELYVRYFVSDADVKNKKDKPHRFALLALKYHS